MTSTSESSTPTREIDPLRVVLSEALPLIARVLGGTTKLADGAGSVLSAVDWEGRTLALLPDGEVDSLARDAAKAGRALLAASASPAEGLSWALPLGGYVLTGSNSARVERENQLLSCLELALPLIAKVAGGEAVIFDKEGRRLRSVLPNGKNNDSVIGKIFESSRRTMDSGRPDVGVSHSFPGALAVRIPLTREFGFGFNNASTVLLGQQLLDEMKRDRGARYTWDDVIGESRAIQEVVELGKLAANTSSNVWIFGESGCGKELFAQAIHNGSARSSRRFVALNCAGVPPGLIESTLFGYEAGAFTGARKGGQRGVFEDADGGTLLLDEISEMDIALQAKLLRVLQEREVTRVGATRPVPVDVRIIAATNVDLRQMVEQGTFRKDLFYRLNVMDLRVPPLRERKEDIPLLAEHFVSRLSFRLGKLVTSVSPEAVARLKAYDWPGNVREFENCIERAINVADGDTIRARHIPPYVGQTKRVVKGVNLREHLRNCELDLIQDVMSECGGSRTAAAKRLGISVTTLWRRLNEEENQD